MGDEGGDVLLQEWSSRFEELIDEENNTEGAIKLLEDVIAKLESLHNADTNLTLATALNDVGKLYANLGFSNKADSCLTRALLIKHKAEQQQQPHSSSNLRYGELNSCLQFLYILFVSHQLCFLFLLCGLELENNKRVSENSKEIAASEPSTSSDEGKGNKFCVFFFLIINKFMYLVFPVGVLFYDGHPSLYIFDILV